jgi:hypothetical protein
MIDAVFADDHAVREAWTRYITTLNDPNLNFGAGFAVRDEKRRELLLEIVKALGLEQKISSAELLRSYMPAFAAEAIHLTMLEREYKRAFYEEYLKNRGISFPAWVPPMDASQPQATQAPPSGGNSGQPATTGGSAPVGG